MESHIHFPIRRMRWFFLPIFSLVIIPFFPFQIKELGTISAPVILNSSNHVTLENRAVKVQKFLGQKRLCAREICYHPIILAASLRYRVDPALVKAIIMAESGYNPTAISKKGAAGLMQLMPATANSLGVEDVFNPEHNVYGGVKYIRQLVNRFDGNLVLAIAAYNAGISNVRKYEGIPPFKATHYYVKKVLEYYEFYKGMMDGKSNRV